MKNSHACFIPTDISADTLSMFERRLRMCIHAKVQHLVVVSRTIADLVDTKVGSLYYKIEQLICKSGIAFTILRVPAIMDDHWTQMSATALEDMCFGPVHGDVKFSGISVKNVAAAAAIIMRNPSMHHNATYRLTSFVYSHTVLAANFSRVFGTTILYQQQIEAEARDWYTMQGTPTDVIDMQLELASLINVKSDLLCTETTEFGRITGYLACDISQWVNRAVAGLAQGTGSSERFVVVGADTLVGSRILQRLTRDYTCEILASCYETAGAGSITTPSYTLPQAFSHGDIAIIVPGHGKDRMAKTLAAIAAAQGRASRMVLLSSVCADLVDTHIGRDAAILEAAAVKCGLPLTVLRLAPLLELLWLQGPHVQGTALVCSPLAFYAFLSGIALEDVVSAVIAVLRGEGGQGERKSGPLQLNLSGKGFSPESLGKAFSCVKGRAVRVLKQSVDEYREELRAHGVKEWEVTCLVELVALARVGSRVLRPSEDFARLTGQQPQGVEDWIVEHMGDLRSRPLVLPPCFLSASLEGSLLAGESAGELEAGAGRDSLAGEVIERGEGDPLKTITPIVTIVVLHAEAMLGAAVTKLLVKAPEAVRVLCFVDTADALEDMRALDHVTPAILRQLSELCLPPNCIVFYPDVPLVSRQCEELRELVAMARRAGAGLVLVSSVLAGLHASDLCDTYLLAENLVTRNDLSHVTVVRLPLLLDSLLSQAKTTRVSATIVGPARVDTPVAYISIADTAEACACILREPNKHNGNLYVLTSEPITMHALCRTLGSLWGFGDALQYRTTSSQECAVTLAQNGLTPLQAYVTIMCQAVTCTFSDDFRAITGHLASGYRPWALRVAPVFRARTDMLLLMQRTDFLTEAASPLLNTQYPNRVLVAENVDSMPRLEADKLVRLWLSWSLAVFVSTLELDEPVAKLSAFLALVQSSPQGTKPLILVVARCGLAAEHAELLQASGLRYVLLEVPVLLEHVFGHLPSIQTDGVLYGFLGDAPMASVAASDVVHAVVNILARAMTATDPSSPAMTPTSLDLTMLQCRFTATQLVQKLASTLQLKLDSCQLRKDVWCRQYAKHAGANIESAHAFAAHLEASCLACSTGGRGQDSFEHLKLGKSTSLDVWLNDVKSTMVRTVRERPENSQHVIIINASGGLLAACIFQVLSAQVASKRWQVQCDSTITQALDQEMGLQALVTEINTLNRDFLSRPESECTTLVLVVPASPSRVRYVAQVLERAKQAGCFAVLLLSIHLGGPSDSELRSDFVAIEGLVRHSGLRFTIVRLPPVLMEMNWLAIQHLVATGDFEGLMGPDARLECLCAKDVAFTVNALLAAPREHCHRLYSLHGTNYTIQRLADLLHARYEPLLSQPVRYTQLSEAQFVGRLQAANYDEWQIADIISGLRVSSSGQETDSGVDLITMRTMGVEDWLRSAHETFMAFVEEQRALGRLASQTKALLQRQLQKLREEVKDLAAKKYKFQKQLEALAEEKLQADSHLARVSNLFVKSAVRIEKLQITMSMYHRA